MTISNRIAIIIGIFISTQALISCHKAYLEELMVEDETSYPVYKPLPSPQLTYGDPQKGLDYLIYGDYMGTGIPYDLFAKRFTNRINKELSISQQQPFQRTGINEGIPYTHTAFVSKTGAKVVNANCFACHSSKLDGQVIIGLGNTFGDYTRNFKLPAKLFNIYVKAKYGKDSPEWQSFAPTRTIIKALSTRTATPNIGLNPAARTAEVAGLMRDPVDLAVLKSPQDTFEMGPINIATDVPPLWHVNKKHALYYNALGRGDFTKLLMQITLAGIEDTLQARAVQENFVHVLAWLKQLKPPEYPRETDPSLAAQGKLLFEENCSKCHGKYGAYPSYPNKLVPLHEIKTDPAYARATLESDLVPWYNQSWYATTTPTSRHQPSEGYIAPPLDGVWCTAPFLHNGSVPSLEDLLNSKQRPAYWERSGDSNDYDFERIGWNYTQRSNAEGKWTYDTTKPGSGNAGHYFGDEFSAAERKAVIEYLKTL